MQTLSNRSSPGSSQGHDTSIDISLLNANSPAGHYAHQSSTQSFLKKGGAEATPAAKRRQAAETIQEYERFSQVLSGVTIVCLLLSLVFLGGIARFSVCFALLVCLGSFAYCNFLVRWIMKKDTGTLEMKVVSDAIKEGAEGFLRTQYFFIAVIASIVSVVLFIVYLFRASPNENVHGATLGLVTSFAFLLGAFCSAAAGYTGVWTSVRVNIRGSSAAARFHYSDALLLCFRGGALSATLSASMCILGISLLYLLCSVVFVSIMGIPSHHIPMFLAGYGFGASFVALFMQLGGGIYTKAADVGADMCGKIEKDIPEDDPRNPAVIADLVGDNVGDCAGSMADVFESIAAEIIATMILGASLAKEAEMESAEPFIFFPLVVHAFDLIVSGIGISMVQPKSDHEDPLEAMKRGYAVALCCALVSFVFVTRFMLHTDKYPSAWWHFLLCGFVGIFSAYLLVLTTQYYTDYNCEPVKKIVSASATGHGTNIIAGVSVGMESTAIPVMIISFSLLASYTLGSNSGLPSHTAGLFGTAAATMGMLCTAVFVLSMNNFGPIADNAGGIVEMSSQPEAVRVITDRLDAVGNVTKAATKGYAVGGSALACFVLFQAFLDETQEFLPEGYSFKTVDIAKVEVMIGGLLGIMMVFLFTGWAIDAVGRTAQQVVWEVRRQFKNMPGIMDGSQRPEYKTCVEIVTRAALREMIRPAVLALASPVVVALFFKWWGSSQRPLLGVEVVAAFLMFGTLTGLLMAMFLDNSGGAWDNAKKLVEKNGGKGSEAHKAAVTGDTVGDPFKDTAGPALHVIITTMSTTVLVLGPLFLGSFETTS